MDSQKVLLVNYGGGKKPQTERPIRPLRWDIKPFKFYAECLNDGITKTYRIDRILDCKDNVQMYLK
jgi:predicted DNA-binding transcriptional regulator YafY